MLPHMPATGPRGLGRAQEPSRGSRKAGHHSQGTPLSSHKAPAEASGMVGSSCRNPKALGKEEESVP